MLRRTVPDGALWRRRAGAFALVALLAALAWQSSTRSVDFPIYHRIATGILNGDYELYPPEVYGGALVPPHGFRYLPAVAFLFVPFALLPLVWAALAFYLLKLAVLAYVSRTAGRWAGLSPHDWGAPLLALFVVAGYAAEELRYGNVHLFTVALMVFAFDRVERGAVTTPAIALALAIATKITPLALLGYFALRGRVAVCVATLAVLAALAIAPAAAVGVRTNAHLLTGFARYAVQKVDESDNYSLRGVLDRAVHAPRSAQASTAPAGVALLSSQTNPAAWLWLVLLAVLGAATLVTVWRPPGDDMTRLLHLSVVLVVMLIASPHTQRRYFVQLFVPALALIGVARAHAGSKRRSAIVGLAATAAVGTVLPLVFGGRRLALAYESVSPYFYGAVILLAALMALVRAMKQEGRSGVRAPAV